MAETAGHSKPECWTGQEWGFRNNAAKGNREIIFRVGKVPDSKGMLGEGRRWDWRAQLNCTSEKKRDDEKGSGRIQEAGGQEVRLKREGKNSFMTKVCDLILC